MIASAKSVAARSWSCSTLLKPQSHRDYGQVTTYLRPKKCRNRGQIVERTHDWSRRSWMIASAKSVAARSWSCSTLLKPQSHRDYGQVTTYLRPKKCRNRGQIVERTHDWSRRSWMIASAKSVAARSWSCSKLLKPQSHRDYGQVTTYLRPKKMWNRGQVVERTYDWSQRSWVITRAKAVVRRSMFMSKTSNMRFQIVSGRI